MWSTVSGAVQRIGVGRGDHEQVPMYVPYLAVSQSDPPAGGFVRRKFKVKTPPHSP